MQRSSKIEEETLFVIKMLTATNSSKRRYAKEGKLDNRTNANRFTIRDKTRSNA